MQQPSFEPYASPVADAAPPPPGTSIRYGEALRFAFRAEKPWMNILIATLISLVPVAGPIALGGWHCEIMQRLVRRHPTPIPTIEFNDFSHYLSRGIQPFVVRMLVSLPLSFFLVFGIMIAGVGGGIAGRSGDPEIVLVIWGVVLLGFIVLSPLLAIVGYAAYTRADLTEDIGASLKPSKLMEFMRITWPTVLGSFFLWGMLSTAIVFVGLIACYVGIFVAGMVLQMGQLHLRWQIYERYVTRGGTPIDLKPAVQLPSEQARANPYSPYQGQQQYPQQQPPQPYPQQPPYPPR